MTLPITPQRVALVVDDSKLARYVLKEMLLDLGIKVETAESAEEALGSLSAFKPDVIFMDHMMPGMDGFQAVQAIKSDPKTAAIPILMYTSKDEGVYVNQARALGAVGVLPKKLKPVQLQEVLVQLKLVPEAVLKPLKESGEVKAKESKYEISSPNTPVHSINEAEIVNAKGTQSSLEELARSASEEQEKDSMRLLFRKLFSEQRDSIKQDQWVLLDAMTANIAPIILATRHKIATWKIVALSCMFILLLSILAILYNALTIAESQRQVLREEIKTQEFTLSRIEKLLGNVERTQSASREGVNGEVNVKPIEWAINHNSQRSFTQTLNSESTQRYITELISQLDDFGFNGSMYIQFHSGRFCQQDSAGGLPMLVGAEHSIDKCHFNTLDINQTAVITEFENFLAQLALEFPLIKIQFEYLGTQFTLQDYPEISADINAGQWNDIAKKNNRFNFALVNVD
jgi:CheY-like chemotaxis protein